MVQIHNTVEGLQSGEMKECPKCSKVKPLIDFHDEKLSTGFGRFCLDCKGKKIRRGHNEAKPQLASDNTKCPKCSSTMYIRTRKRDDHKFYGCSRFPKCRGTREYKN